MQLIRGISKYIIHGLIPVIFLMYANASVNKHFHKISDGEIVIHAHPFSKSTSGNSTHNHTNQEIKFLAIIGNPEQLIFLILLGIILTLLQKGVYLLTQTVKVYDTVIPSLIRNKAPPF